MMNTKYSEYGVDNSINKGKTRETNKDFLEEK